MKIETLKDDIYALFREKGWSSTADASAAFGQDLAAKIASRAKTERGPPSLRLSQIGKPDRQLWYGINTPELAEPLSPETRMKFLYGDIIEEMVLWLAQEAGHEVTDQQKTVEINGVEGHIDCLVDGVLVDVKSSSTPGMHKFRDGNLYFEDSFGYLEQLSSYGFALGQSRGAFISVDKTLGHIEVNQYELLRKNYNEEIDRKRYFLSKNIPPDRCYSDEPMGKSGNRKLGVGCSYCPFKHTCWPKLRTFLYSSGPVFLTDVVRLPDVREVTKEQT